MGRSYGGAGLRAALARRSARLHLLAVDLGEAAVLLAAAFLAGAINAVAGGGSLVSFPAIVAVGYDTKAANVTNTVALWPGYAAGSFGYRSELRRQRRRVLTLTLPSIAGAVAGAVILLATPTRAFDLVVPFLILFACALMVAQDRLAGAAVRAEAPGEAPITPGLLVATFFLAVYGAYFGAGLGIMLLAVLGILLPDEIQHSNALKNILSFVMNAMAVVWFALFGPVRWAVAAVMAVGAIAGGYLGVGVARRLGRKWLRVAVVSYGLVSAAVLFLRAL
jgi:uncharacterized membrane protein YfcA